MLESSYIKNVLEAGCDEAGRGCLAGPVVAAAVILPEDFNHNLLNDSKQLSEKQRMQLEPYILENAICYGIGIVKGSIPSCKILVTTLIKRWKK